MVEELKSMVGLEETILYEGKPDKKCFIFESIFNPLMPFAPFGKLLFLRRWRCPPLFLRWRHRNLA